MSRARWGWQGKKMSWTFKARVFTKLLWRLTSYPTEYPCKKDRGLVGDSHSKWQSVIFNCYLNSKFFLLCGSAGWWTLIRKWEATRRKWNWMNHHDTFDRSGLGLHTLHVKEHMLTTMHVEAKAVTPTEAIQSISKYKFKLYCCVCVRAHTCLYKGVRGQLVRVGSFLLLCVSKACHKPWQQVSSSCQSPGSFFRKSLSLAQMCRFS